MTIITQNLGKIVPNHRGGFRPDWQYRVLDETFYFGASYRVIKEPPLGTYPTDEEYWVIVSESSAKLVNVEIIDTNEITGTITIRFSYEDLTFYDIVTGPLIPEITKPDWNAPSGPAEILNKPNLGDAAYLGLGTTANSVAAGNHGHSTATTSSNGFMSSGDKSKLDGIASGATNNNTNEHLLARANHTGVQAISTVSGLTVALNSKVNTASLSTPNGVATLDTQGRLPQSQGGGQPVLTPTYTPITEQSPSTFSSSYNHVGFFRLASNTSSPIDFPVSWASSTGITSGVVEGYISPSGNYAFSYQIITGSIGNRFMRRALNSTTWGDWEEIASSGVATISANGLMSSTDKIKLNGIATGATANQTNSYLLNRSNHTGSQPQSTIDGLGAALNDKLSLTGGNVVGKVVYSNWTPYTAEARIHFGLNAEDVGKAIQIGGAGLSGTANQSHNHGVAIGLANNNINGTNSSLFIINSISGIGVTFNSQTISGYNYNFRVEQALTIGSYGFRTTGEAKIGGSVVNPDISAVLELDSTSKGFLPPRMTAAQISTNINLSANPEGCIAYDRTNHILKLYNGSQWIDIGATIGVEQTWQNVTASRLRNTTYQNTTGKPIQLSILTDYHSNLLQCSIDGSDWVTIGRSDYYVMHNAIIPINNYYRLTGNGPIVSWSELR